MESFEEDEMNKIMCECVQNANDFLKAGMLYKNPLGEDEVYMLCRLSEGWVAVNLATGNRWSDTTNTASEAVGGLTLFKKEATIVIK